MNQPSSRFAMRRLRWARRGTHSAVLLAGVSVLGVLYVGKPVLAPLAMALWITLLLTPVVEGLHRLHVPRALGAAVLLLALVIGAATLVEALRQPASTWLANAPTTLHQIEQKIRPVQRLMANVDQVGRHAEHIAEGTPDSASPDPSTRTGTSIVAVAATLPRVALCILTSAIITFLLLASGPQLLAQMVGAMAGASENRVRSLVEAIRAELGRYYATIALINLGLGVATSIIMQLLGMPSPLLWGTLAALFNFVPYFGPACTLLIVSGVALVTFDSLGQVFAVAGGFLSLVALEGQVVQPLLVGRRLELRPLAVLLGVWFFSALWGVVGIILAVPVLLTLKVAARANPGSSALLAFLSADERRWGACQPPLAPQSEHVRALAQRVRPRRNTAGESPGSASAIESLREAPTSERV